MKNTQELPKYRYVNRFRHCFDLGAFYFFKSINDEEALFIKEQPLEYISYILPEARAHRYSWKEMTPWS